MNPFEYLNSINYTKADIMVDDIAEKKYNAFMVNRGLSYFYETALIANEMNINHHLDSRIQYDFLKSIVRKGKRYSKWAKSEKIDSLPFVMEYYGYSRPKALQVLPLLTRSNLEYIQKKLYKGGKS
jgi:hypothetical protein